MREVPTISVVIPAYNAAAYVGEAIESVLKQTLPASEVIVVDDGSTDDTRSVAERYGRRVTYLRQNNAGVSAARNLGVRIATGSWIAFLDADDHWRADKLQKQIDALNRNPSAVLVYSDFLIVEGNCRRIVEVCPPQQLLPALRYRCPFMPSVVLMAREAFLNAGAFDQTLQGTEDWDLWVKIVMKHSTRAFVHVAEPLTYYRVVPGSLSQRPIRQLQQYLGMVEHRLLDGLTGIPRAVQRRKILARLYRDAAVALREQAATGYTGYMWQSLRAWPLPTDAVQSDRYKIAAAMFIKALVGR